MTEPLAVTAQTVVDRVLTRGSRRAEGYIRHSLADMPPGDVEVILAAVASGRTPSGGALDLPAHMQRVAYQLRPYASRHRSDEQTVVFWPEDFPEFFIDLALEVGLDLEQYGYRLDPTAKSPELVVGRAFTALAQVEGVYTEVPNALTESVVPRRFLYVVAAAMVGIVLERATDAGPLVAAGLTGVGALFVNILSARYDRDLEPSMDFFEELVFREIEQNGKLSIEDLQRLTSMTAYLLRNTVKRLLAKRLLRRVVTVLGTKQVHYELAER